MATAKRSFFHSSKIDLIGIGDVVAGTKQIYRNNLRGIVFYVSATDLLSLTSSLGRTS